MKSFKLLLGLGLAAVAAHAADTCPMQMPKAYSADMETSAAGMTNAVKIFVDGDKMRTESNSGGMVAISIIRQDKKMSYTLLPAQKMVMETAIPDAPAAAAPAATGSGPGWEKVGTAKINGEDCTEYRVSAAGASTSYFVNSAKFPVRMVTASATIDYKNIKLGAPDAALFEVPAGYSKPGEAPAQSDQPAGPAASSADDSAAKPAAAPAKPEPKKKKLGGMLGR